MTRRAPASTAVDVSLVASILTQLASDVAGVHLLHAGAATSSSAWEGDIDLVVTASREHFLNALNAAVRAAGFSVVLEVQRVMNTLEIDLLFPGSTSWTIVAVDRRGVILNVDVTFAPGVEIEAGDRPGRFGVREVAEASATNYLILKRIRKEDGSAEAWSAIAERARGAAPDLREFLPSPLVEEIAGAVIGNSRPTDELLRRAHSALRRRRASR